MDLGLLGARVLVTTAEDVADAALWFSSAHAARQMTGQVMAVGQQRLREHVESALAALPADTAPMDRICSALQTHLGGGTPAVRLRDGGHPQPAPSVRASTSVQVMGALNWTPEWWNPAQGPLSVVIATAESLVRNGLGPGPGSAAPQSMTEI